MYGYYLNSDLKPHRNLLFSAPVACLGVDEEVSDMCLVLLVIVGQAGNDGSVEVPGVYVIRNQYLDPVGAFCLHREEGAHQSGADASGWMGDLEFQDEVEMFDQVGCDGRSAVVRGDIRSECNEQIFLDGCCIVEGDRELWERGEWFRIRSVFVAQLCESVICTYEEIVAADVCAWVIRELLGWNTFGYGRPFQLHVVFQFSPGFDGPAMNGCVGELCRSAWKDSLRLCPPVAFAVTVVE